MSSKPNDLYIRLQNTAGDRFGWMGDRGVRENNRDTPETPFGYARNVFDIFEGFTGAFESLAEGFGTYHAESLAGHRRRWWLPHTAAAFPVAMASVVQGSAYWDVRMSPVQAAKFWDAVRAYTIELASILDLDPRSESDAARKLGAATEAVRELPRAVGQVVGEVAAGAADAVGRTAGGVLSGVLDGLGLYGWGVVLVAGYLIARRA